jgi:hypothetical protein
VLTEYSTIEALLSAGEVKGRAWVLDRAQRRAFVGVAPRDFDILELHRAMFEDFARARGGREASPSGQKS